MNDASLKVGSETPHRFTSLRALGLNVAPWAPAPAPPRSTRPPLAFGFGPLATAAVSAALPPKTVPVTISLRSVKTARCEIEVSVEVVPDGKDPALGRKAETKLDVSRVRMGRPGYTQDG